jgi:catechol 2,3-dioxygenase-like lactoylglutathione lyase family enzyme
MQMSTDIRPNSLDHVALWVDERGPMARFLCDHLGMHVIEETDTFTLVGVDAKLGKLTLFDAEGPRERGALEWIALRVSDVDRVAAGLPDPVAARSGDGGTVRLEAPGGLPLALVAGDGVEFDLDHVQLRLPDLESALSGLATMGFDRRDGSLAVADREVRVVQGPSDDDGRPLLNHIALLVDSALEVQRDAEAHGIEVDDVKDAPNTIAVFLRGPAGVRIEYVEHKPGFALV